ncbi:MAG: GntR family transcriptional regulator [Candidatus Brocadiia bacterium]
MPVNQIQHRSLKEYIHADLVQQITRGDYNPGDRLPSMSTLAEEYGTSVNPVQEAYIRLAQEGYVEKRPGSGTYVIDSSAPAAMSDTVVLAMRPEGHVWGRLSRLLSHRLHDDLLMPVHVNPNSENSNAVLRSLARSEARAFLVLGSAHQPLHIFHQPPFCSRVIVGLVEWVGPAFPGLLRVLGDYRHGGELMAEHLRERGHRKVLMVAAPMQAGKMVDVMNGGTGPHGRGIDQNDHGVAFLSRWKEAGAGWDVMATDVGMESRDGMVRLNEDEFLSHFKGSDIPTAVFGWRDVDAAAAQKVLRERRPELLEDVEITGFFNTPWSRGAHPPFSSVDLNIESIVGEACRMVEKRLAGDEVEPDIRWIKPRLVVRPEKNS